MSAVELLAPEAITLRIATVRGKRVLLDSDLAALYEVQTKRFNEAVKRNLAKFPADFMRQLTADEWVALRSQFATLNAAGGGRGQHRKYLPYAFTEHGAIMAATILSSVRRRAQRVRGTLVHARPEQRRPSCWRCRIRIPPPSRRVRRSECSRRARRHTASAGSTKSGRAEPRFAAADQQLSEAR